MKKLLSIILALLMLVGILASCGNYKSPDKKPANTGSNEETTGGGNSNLENDPENKPSEDKEQLVLPEGIESVKINEADASAEFVLCDKESSFSATEAYDYCNGVAYETEDTHFDISIDLKKSYPTEVSLYSASIMQKGNLQNVYSVDSLDNFVSSFKYEENKIEMSFDLDREEISEDGLVVIEIEINYEDSKGFLFIGIKKPRIKVDENAFQVTRLLINGDEAKFILERQNREQDIGVIIPIESYYEKAYCSDEINYFVTIEFEGALPTEITHASMRKKEVGTDSEKNLLSKTIEAKIRENIIELDFSLDQKITSDVFYIIDVSFVASSTGAIHFAIKSLK